MINIVMASVLDRISACVQILYSNTKKIEAILPNHHYKGYYDRRVASSGCDE